MAVNPNPSHLDSVQIDQREHDATNDAKRVSLVAGTISLTEEATAAPGGPTPALLKVAGGVDGSDNVTVLRTDTNGELQIDVLSSALPAGAATEATLASIDGNVIKADTDNVTVVVTPEVSFSLDGVKTSVLLDTTTPSNSTPMPVSLVQASGSIIDPATEATLQNAETAVTSIDGKTPALGQAVAAASVPVILASDQALPLPAGAATEVTLSTIDTTTQSIDGKTPALGQALSAASVPVVIASDQTVGVSVSSLPLPTGAATEASLAAFSSKSAAGLVPNAFDSIVQTYITVGNGIGQVGIVEYKTGGIAGTLIATLTLVYDAQDRLASVEKS